MSASPDPTAAFPGFPDGFWRVVELYPGPGRIVAGLEDNIHRFELAIDHDGTAILGCVSRAVRVPLSACPGASPHLDLTLQGMSLAEVSACDPAEQCTHLLDLAIAAAAHAGDAQPLRFAMWVTDRKDGAATAILFRDGAETIRWHLNGTELGGGQPWADKDLRRLSHWKRDLPPVLAEGATMLRRAVLVSGGRAYAHNPPPLTGQFVRSRIGACYTYHEARAFSAQRRPGWKDRFDWPGDFPLRGFNPTASLGDNI